MKESHRTVLKRIAIGAGVLAGLLLITTTGFVIWALPGAGPSDLPEGVLESDGRVMVSLGNAPAFLPADQMPRVGMILYTGGKVRELSYAGIARRLAEQGIGVFLPRMPLNLAVLNANAADRIIAANPCIEHWIIAGHSLGGAMAATYADGNREKVSGLVLLASYPAGSNDLSDSDVQVLSVYAEHDGLAEPADIVARQDLLPSTTRYLLIPGGNHAGFGHYGAQDGDGESRITRESQQSITADAIVQLAAALGR